MASTPADAVATFERPMYRPDDAFGMMSVISAQSTARKMPAESPYSSAPTKASGSDRRERRRCASPTAPSAQRDVDHPLAADAVGDPRRRDDRDRPCPTATSPTSGMKTRPASSSLERPCVRAR